MKKTCKYYLSVEGETEKWYFEHLQNLINNNREIPYKVKFSIKISKSITKMAKSIPVIAKTQVFHICDYESNDSMHTKQFENILKELNEVRKIKKDIDYKLGYTNFSFELWLILHKNQQKGKISHRTQYINGINKAYNENFAFIDEYKEEKNFKKILAKITLEDVILAVKHGKEIRVLNEENSQKDYRKYGQFEYYIENPDITVNQCVERILKDCGVYIH